MDLPEQKEKVQAAEMAVEIDNNPWYGHEIQTDAVKIEDPGEGDAVVIRHFFFKAPPGFGKTIRPSKQQIFAEFKHLIATQLWADGLQPREDLHIEVHTRSYLKKVSKTIYQTMLKNGSDFVIMVPAEARKGVLLHEKPLRA